MNYTQDMAYSKLVSLFRAWLIITEVDEYHNGHLYNIAKIDGMVTMLLECAYLPEDREEMRDKAYLQAWQLYRHKTGDAE